MILPIGTKVRCLVNDGHARVGMEGKVIGLPARIGTDCAYYMIIGGKETFCGIIKSRS